MKKNTPASPKPKRRNIANTDKPSAALAAAREPEFLRYSRELCSHDDTLRSGNVQLPDNILLFHRDDFYRDLMTGTRRPVQGDWHYQYVLIASLRGTGHVVVNGKIHTLRAGCHLLIMPYQVHRYTWLDPKGFDWIFIEFTHSLPPAGLTGDAICLSPPGLDHELANLVRDFYETTKIRGRIADSEKANLLREAGTMVALRLELLLRMLSRETRKVKTTPREFASSGERLLLRVHAVVNANAESGQHLTRHKIARQLGISESHLRALFREATGMSLGTFQHELRMQHATAMLVNDKGLSVEAVSACCGYATPFAFSRAFEKYWGMSPRKFLTMRARRTLK